MKLSQCYTFKGKTYGPGDDVDVPDDFPTDNVKKQEKAFAERTAARNADNDDAEGVNKDGLGYVQDAVDEKGAVKQPLRSGQPDDSQKNGAGNPDDNAETLSDDEINSMTKAELEDYASSKSIDLGDAKTKAEMVDAIKASR